MTTSYQLAGDQAPGSPGGTLGGGTGGGAAGGADGHPPYTEPHARPQMEVAVGAERAGGPTACRRRRSQTGHCHVDSR